MTIGQYVAKFDELSKFSSYLKNNPDGRWKLTKFEWGLRLEIREKVSTLEIKDFITLVNKCKIAEKSFLEIEFERDRQNFLKRKRVAEIQKKNNFKSRVNLGKGRQMPVRNPYLRNISAENLMAPNLAFLAKMFATGTGSQDIMPKTTTQGNY